MSVFFVDCPKIPFWSVLSLSCCCLFKIYTSYIISKSNQSKVISVESWKRLRNDYSTKPMDGKFLSSDSILSRMSLCSYFVSWKIYLFTRKKITFMSSTEIISFRTIFLRLRHEKMYIVEFCDVGILRKCGIYFHGPNVLPNFLSTKSRKEDTIYMGIVCMSFLFYMYF